MTTYNFTYITLFHTTIFGTYIFSVPQTEKSPKRNKTSNHKAQKCDRGMKRYATGITMYNQTGTTEKENLITAIQVTQNRKKYNHTEGDAVLITQKNSVYLPIHRNRSPAVLSPPFPCILWPFVAFSLSLPSFARLTR